MSIRFPFCSLIKFIKIHLIEKKWKNVSIEPGCLLPAEIHRGITSEQKSGQVKCQNGHFINLK